MNKQEKLEHDKLIEQNERLKEELLEIKYFNLEKVIDKVIGEGFMEDVLNVYILTLEKKIEALTEENKLLRDSLKKQLAKRLYTLITEKR
ncbi:hypothetical protein IJ732_04625 [bacterium]|nr:hypothetical protein [bacterium]